MSMNEHNLHINTSQKVMSPSSNGDCNFQIICHIANSITLLDSGMRSFSGMQLHHFLDQLMQMRCLNVHY